MIGALLAARFVAKKPWGVSAIFWAILLILGLVFGTVMGTNLIVLFILGLVIFLGVAWFYLKVPPIWLGVRMDIFSYIVNIVISWLLSGISGGIWIF